MLEMMLDVMLEVKLTDAGSYTRTGEHHNDKPHHPPLYPCRRACDCRLHSRRRVYDPRSGSGGCANLRTPHDPIPGWFEEWKAIRAEVNKLDDGDDTLEAVMHELEHKICTTEPVSRAGAIAQLEYALDDFGEYMMGNIWKDLDTKLFANLLGALKSGVA